MAERFDLPAACRRGRDERPISARSSRTTRTATSSSCTPRATSTTSRRSSSARCTCSRASGFVIVIRHGAASELHSARERLEAQPELLREGPAAAVWAIMDKIVDDYEPVMAGLENDVEEVEVDVFGERSDETKRIYFLRRELAEFYRAVHPLLQPLDVLVSAKMAPTPRRCWASTCATSATTSSASRTPSRTQRELLTSVLQANLAVISVQQNDVVKKISGWAAIITVPTLIASIYGMNFDHMPELALALRLPAGADGDGRGRLRAAPRSAPRRLAVARSRDGTSGKPDPDRGPAARARPRGLAAGGSPADPRPRPVSRRRHARRLRRPGPHRVHRLRASRARSGSSRWR